MSTEQKVSRRTFLKVSTAAVAGAFLEAAGANSADAAQNKVKRKEINDWKPPYPITHDGKSHLAINSASAGRIAYIAEDQFDPHTGKFTEAVLQFNPDSPANPVEIPFSPLVGNVRWHNVSTYKNKVIVDSVVSVREYPQYVNSGIHVLSPRGWNTLWTIEPPVGSPGVAMIEDSAQMGSLHLATTEKYSSTAGEFRPSFELLALDLDNQEEPTVVVISNDRYLMFSRVTAAEGESVLSHAIVTSPDFRRSILFTTWYPNLTPMAEKVFDVKDKDGQLLDVVESKAVYNNGKYGVVVTYLTSQSQFRTGFFEIPPFKNEDELRNIICTPISLDEEDVQQPQIICTPQGQYLITFASSPYTKPATLAKTTDSVIAKEDGKFVTYKDRQQIRPSSSTTTPFIVIENNIWKRFNVPNGGNLNSPQLCSLTNGPQLEVEMPKAVIICHRDNNLWGINIPSSV